MVAAGTVMVAAGVAGVAVLAGPGQPLPPPPPESARIYFLNLGQGDGAFIRTADGATALVDGGESNRGPKLVAWLRSMGVQKVDWIMPSHPHADHIGGLNAVLEQLPVGAALVSRQPATSKTYRRQEQLLRDKGVPVTHARDGLVLRLGAHVTATVLNPPVDLLATKEPVEDNSVVLRVCTGGTCALFTGDIGDEGERALLGRHGGSPEVLRSQVLKVSHHGAAEPNDPALLQLVRPEAAVISAGAANQHKHPKQRALDRLTAAGATIYCTFVEGTVLVELTPSGHTVKPLPDLVIQATVSGVAVVPPALQPRPCRPQD